MSDLDKRRDAGPAGSDTAITTVDRGQLEALDDAALVARARAEMPHATAAFEVLVRRYEPVVYRTCRRLLRIPADADEAAQEIFLRVFRNLAAFEGRSSFRTWLYRIVHNECMTLVTRRQTRSRRERPEPAAGLPDRADPAPGPDELVGDDPQVQDALAGLEPRDREILALRFVADLSLQEVARVLDIGLSAAKMRFYRALERFEKAYLARPP